ncbi:hypothetical protein ADUPG1_005607, partial [Aduncisulcus paluster]
EAKVRVVAKDGEPWFVAKDVAFALGYADTAQAGRNHCKGVVEMTTPSAGGAQAAKCIRRNDVFRLIVKSKLPSAERFESWVFDEVLPSIHDTGTYIDRSSASPEFL